MTPAGQRRERVTFQDRALDAEGEALGDWTAGFARMARVVARTRGEEALQQRLQGVVPVEVWVLDDSATRTLTTAWRMLWRGAAYNIAAIAPSEDRREWQLLARNDQSDG